MVGLVAICLAALMFGLEISSVPVILPTVGQELRGSFADTEWIMSGYTIGVVTLLMPAGTLGDRFGHRRVLVLAVTAFGLASLLCGLAPTPGWLIAGRVAQGMSGGAMLACQIALLSHQFPAGPERTRAFGWWGVVFGVGLGFGPAIGGEILATLGWQWVFLVHVCVACVVVPLVLLGPADVRDPRAGRMDLAGLGTLILAVVGLTFFITEGPTIGLTAPLPLAALAVSLVSAVCFVLVELRGEAPMIDFRVFRVRAFSGALFSSAGMNFSFWPLIIYLPVYLQAGLGYSAGVASVVLLAYTLPTLVLPPVAERLMLRHRPAVIIPAGLALVGVGLLAVMAGSMAAQPSWLTVVPGMLVAGIGLGLTNTPTTNTTTASAPSDRSGMASGIDMTARMTSLAINISLMGLLFAAGVSDQLRRHLPASTDVDALATRVANGNGPIDAVASQALGHATTLVTLYGGVAALVLAVASRLTFGFRRAR
ncbi:EmrB/QacA subfamily drug resistance transporter [Actinocrispum wychmicini]|uniref:EmrB/QacA subfamily drug resistance transporter n=2 Tax=Actinocrispum wychmicini TaxID=1213861 RepID=A0A4R2J5W7_9PSEU|nr:EmrB/QacA subfamily drug resistance transporter [Actinocrispum wychmicini]